MLGVVLAALLLVVFAWSEWAILSAFVLVCVAWNAHANEMIDSHTMKMRVMFWDNCLYRLEPPHDKDINKLFGVGFGNHMKYSARFGWNSSGEQIDIYAYVRHKGKANWRHLTSCSPNESVTLSLTIYYGKYAFSAIKPSGENAVITMPRTAHWLYRWMPYRLYPYFGGEKTAPHSMTLQLASES